MIDKLKSIFHKVNISTDQELWLKRIKIGTFIDIGAYIGEYVDYAHRIYPHAQIYAFEPLGDCYKNLVKKTENMKRVKVYNLALGDRERESVIHRSSYAPSSSLLPMSNLHKKAFPFSSGSTKQNIQVKTLDSVFQNIHLKPNIFIKMDTQGYEDKVIRGGKGVIQQTAIIQIEVSFAVLYQGQPLFHDIYMQLHKLGFAFHGIHNQITSPRDGYILQAHAYFLNRSNEKNSL